MKYFMSKPINREKIIQLLNLVNNKDEYQGKQNF